MKIKLHDKEFFLYQNPEDIARAVLRMAARINIDYKEKSPVLLPILNGAFIFAADLVKQLEIPTEISFIKVSSYKDTQSSGEVRQVLGLDINIENRDVILLEDIIDSGLTVHTVMQQLAPMNACSMKVAALFHKPTAAKMPVTPDYVGITLPDKFVVGYGLDYNGLGRNLQGLYILNEN